MGGGASTQRHLAEIKRLKEQNELLKRQTVLQEKKLGLLMSELKDKKTFMANIKDKKKRLAVSSEVLREITENEKFLEDFKPPVFKKNGQEQNLIMTLVIKHILFKGLSQTVLADCVGAFKKEPEMANEKKLRPVIQESILVNLHSSARTCALLHVLQMAQ